MIHCPILSFCSSYSKEEYVAALAMLLKSVAVLLTNHQATSAAYKSLPVHKTYMKYTMSVMLLQKAEKYSSF